MVEVIVEYLNDRVEEKIRTFFASPEDSVYNPEAASENAEENNELTGPWLGKIKYHLPLINSYVLEISEDDLWRLEAVVGISSVSKTAAVSAQMDAARQTVRAQVAHNGGFFGYGITIAVLDTGVSPVADLCSTKNRLIAFKDFVNGRRQPYDDNGHGTHCAAIAAGSGILSHGKYAGIAPSANLVGVKVLDAEGVGCSSDVLAGLQWIVDNRERYNIRVANLSVGTNELQLNDPLVKAVEAAWDAGIVMTIAAGNNGPAPSSVTSPGVSRKVVTVGASDDCKPVQIRLEASQNYSGRGPTADCIIKPDILAPGADIVSCLSQTLSKKRAKAKLNRSMCGNYVTMSGTSMSTPIVSGAIALLLEKEPTLSPNEVKLRIKKSAECLEYPKNQQGWGLLNIEKLLWEV